MAGEIEINSPICGKMSNNQNQRRIQTMVQDYINKHQYVSALFWADKLVTLSRSDVECVLLYAQTLFLTGQYHRASHLLTNTGLHKDNLKCRHLAAQCHFECREYQEALDILDYDIIQHANQSLREDPSNPKPMVDPWDAEEHNEIRSCISLLRGQIYENLDNRHLAEEAYREALKMDVHCYQAFNSLVTNHMLTAKEERELLDSLPFSKQCPDEELEMIQFLYENKLKKYSSPTDVAVPPNLEGLDENLDVVVNLAERHYYNCDFRTAHKITCTVLKQDPYNCQCLPLHIATLVELNLYNDLFQLAHKLVDLYPTLPVAWFAVGCYYLVIGKNEPARRYLSKATSLDRVYGPAWLAFGHSFAAENEHDQAMAAYFTAAQLMKGCHLPVLYIGLEYGLTNNPKLADRFFLQAIGIAPDDPFVSHEMGVIAFQNGDWDGAENYFRYALNMIDRVSSGQLQPKWEPLFNNMGHTCRKLKKYEDALEYHRKALILCPNDPSTYTAIGYVYSLTAQNAKAVDYFHKALGLRRDDTFSTTMLTNSIEQLMNEMDPLEGGDVNPSFDDHTDIPLTFLTPPGQDGGANESAESGLDSSLNDSSMMVEMEGND